MVCKVHIFLEGHKILRNLHRRFVLSSASQIYGGDFAKFCGLCRSYELLKFWKYIQSPYEKTKKNFAGKGRVDWKLLIHIYYNFIPLVIFLGCDYFERSHQKGQSCGVPPQWGHGYHSLFWQYYSDLECTNFSDHSVIKSTWRSCNR